ncbi:MAG: serine/threonine-protein kinase [Gemmatimonadales bacterium]|nr:serine/threonine-protein kinase [Gemmatimonadales bacterium]
MADQSESLARDALQSALGAGIILEDQLLGGGMSTVYRARDVALNRLVVVKVLPAELAAAVSVERFRREILVSAALQHPHIVPVLSAGEIDGLPYFVMPFIDGESLRTRLTRGPLAVREAVAILKDVARALSYAHTNDVVHRDIKPDNILLTGGSAVVTDFGVAKALQASRASRRQGHISGAHGAAMTASGIAIGTPAYMAPEQAAGDPNTDHRADLYALGIVAWEMMTGAAPFHGLSPQQVMASHVIRTPPGVTTRRYDVPRAFAAVIDHLLQKEPRDRPRYAADVVRALEDPAVLSGEFGGRPAGAWRRARRFALGGAAITLALALLSYLLLRE